MVWSISRRDRNGQSDYAINSQWNKYMMIWSRQHSLQAFRPRLSPSQSLFHLLLCREQPTSLHSLGLSPRSLGHFLEPFIQFSFRKRTKTKIFFFNG